MAVGGGEEEEEEGKLYDEQMLSHSHSHTQAQPAPLPSPVTLPLALRAVTPPPVSKPEWPCAAGHNNNKSRAGYPDACKKTSFPAGALETNVDVGAEGKIECLIGDLSTTRSNSPLAFAMPATQLCCCDYSVTSNIWGGKEQS